MTHTNAPLNIEGRRRLVERCRTRPIAHVAAEMGLSRACASKWVNRWRRFGEAGLRDRGSVPQHSPEAAPAWVVAQIEDWRREHKWSAQRITDELASHGVTINRRTVTRHQNRLGLNQRRFLDPNGETNRKPGKIVAHWPDHMDHLDVKKVGHIPDGGGWRIHGRVASRFTRIETRQRARALVEGLLADVPRKNCWSLAKYSGGVSPEGMQHLLCKAVWDADVVRDDVAQLAVEYLGEQQAVLVLDETGDLEKSSHTVAVQHQYTGTSERVKQVDRYSEPFSSCGGGKFVVLQGVDGFGDASGAVGTAA